MINGYVTVNELKILTGLTDKTLNTLIRDGLVFHELSYITQSGKKVEEKLFDLNEIEKWFSLHIY